MRAWKVAASLLLGAVGLLALASASEATPIGPNCGTCQGSIYELSYSGSPIATTATTETYQITYTVNTAGYNGGGVYLDAVALKVSSSIVDATLVSAPGGVAKWKELAGGLANAGCTGSGSGFDCVVIKVLGNAPAVPNGTYTWVFDIEVHTDTLFTGVDEASVKARYLAANGVKKGALVSEGISLTNLPEPSAALLAAMSFGISFRARRRRR